ncbi:siderophore ABC transporter substrate-binding protein [Bacillus salitolerans]|uniref:Siderophore ABC transporter substrate-binding protein n=1 Tax=Bacillus salitolerans TaxID=1437434 RepID=A0ABW4LUW9_9BACI
MKKNILSIFMIAMLALVLAACGTSTETTGEAETKTESQNANSTEGKQEEKEEVATEPTEHAITHELGEVVVKHNPQTVVVFDFGALDTLDKLGVEVAGVAKASTLPSYLSKYEDDKYVNVGSLKEPDFETIYGMKPDLIIISGRQSAAYEELNKIAPTVFISIDNSNYMESFTNNVKLLAQLFGKDEAAEAELVTINETIASLQDITNSDEKKGLFVLTTGGKLSAYGSGSRFGIIHDVFGVKAADENIEASTHGMSVTFEYIAEKNPDYLFVIDRDSVVSGEGNASDVFNNELVNKTKAAKANKIVYLDPAVWYLSGGGLISTAQMVEEIKAALK